MESKYATSFNPVEWQILSSFSVDTAVVASGCSLGVWKERGMKYFKAVDSDECTGELPPMSGSRIFHFVENQVELLDHVSVTIPITKTP